MNFLEEMKGVLATLRTQRFRTFLTLLGIILGVSTLVVFSSLIAGMGKFMERKMQEASGEDVISVARSWNQEKPKKYAPPINLFDSLALGKTPTLEDSTVLNRYSQRVSFGSREGQVIYVIGTKPQALSFYGLEVARGRFVERNDLFDCARVAVLGSEATKKLLPGEKEPLGKEVKLKGQRFRVVGVLKPKPAMGMGMWTWDGSAVIPESSFVNRMAQSKEIGEIVVKASAPSLERFGLVRLAYAVKAVVLERHHGIQNFRITDPIKDAQTQGIAHLIVVGLEGAIAFVCLLVGGINIMNIMLVTVSQRKREIGLRRALGATKRDVQRQFLSEAAILAGLGGLLGVAGGVLVAWLLSLVLTLFFGYWPYFFMPWQTALGFSSSLLTGIAFGWIPARQAANLSPIDCLRTE
ncbi:MAG TPA: ABC transporter permease [Chroococcales cyanobacterium]